MEPKRLQLGTAGFKSAEVNIEKRVITLHKRVITAKDIQANLNSDISPAQVTMNEKVLIDGNFSLWDGREENRGKRKALPRVTDVTTANFGFSSFDHTL